MIRAGDIWRGREVFEDEEGNLQQRVLLIDGAAGVYVPQEFATSWERDLWLGDTIGGQGCLDEVLKGPDAEFYWESWEYILANASHTDKKGTKWHLEQDGDLWAVHYLTDEEIEKES